MRRAVELALRTPRQRGLAVVMVLLAAVCIAAGTWQIDRFDQTVRTNNALTGNAGARTVAMTNALVPFVGIHARPPQSAYRFRRVAVSGQYLGDREQYVEQDAGDGVVRFVVLTPLRTRAGIMLVARGSAAPRRVTRGQVAPPPDGTVRVTGRLEVADYDASSRGRLVSAIAPAQQAIRLRAPVYDTYLSLDPRQPGSAGLVANAAPDLDNPAGGAFEGQHFAYIIQWYLFALLALAAPFGYARHEITAARRRFLGPEDELEIDDPLLTGELDGTAREALPGGVSRAALAGATSDSVSDPAALHDAALVPRAAGELVRPAGPSDEEWARATKLADRYGMSLGERSDPRLRRWRRRTAESADELVRDSSQRAHRPMDAHHAAYNDYLWQLALADGEAVPEGDAPTDDALRQPAGRDGGGARRRPTRTVDESGRDVDAGH